MNKLNKGARITGGARVRLTIKVRKKYEKGASIRELAQELGRSYGFVHRILVQDGVSLRGRGGNHRPGTKGGPADG